MLTESNPIYSFIETGIAGMSVDVSIRARLLATGLSYLGLGYIFAKGREFSKEIFKITQKTKEKIQHFHDMTYTTAFNLALTPIIYYISGARGWREIALGVCTASFWGAINGGALGASVDVFEDLASLKSCERRWYPNVIKRQNPKVKKTIAIGLVATSIGLMALIYSSIPKYRQKESSEKIPSIEQVTERIPSESPLEASLENP